MSENCQNTQKTPRITRINERILPNSPLNSGKTASNGLKSGVNGHIRVQNQNPQNTTATTLSGLLEQPLPMLA